MNINKFDTCKKSESKTQILRIYQNVLEYKKGSRHVQYVILTATLFCVR